MMMKSRHSIATRHLPTPPLSSSSDLETTTTTHPTNLKKSEIYLSLLDPTSSDPPSDSPSQIEPPSTFKKKLLEHLKPNHIGSSRSLAGKKVVEDGRRKRGVIFSCDHLGSLDATPNHRYNPYERKSTYSTNSLPSSTHRNPTTGSSNHSNHFPIRRPTIVKIDLGLPTPVKGHAHIVAEEDEPGTDDEFDDLNVSDLLLSNATSSSSTSSPTTSLNYTLSFPTRVEPRSILKKWSLKIPLVENALEGSRKNGGRVKHLFNFDYSYLLPALSTQSEISPFFGGKVLSCATNNLERTSLNSGNQEEGSKGAKENVSVGMNSLLKGKGSDRKDDQDGSKRLPPISSTKAPNLLQSNRLTREIRSALETIKASLRPISATHIRQQPDRPEEVESSPNGTGVALRFRSPIISKLLAQDGENILRVPILLPEVEMAYALLTKALIEYLTAPHLYPTALEPLIELQRFLFAALDRDIGNATLDIPSTISPHQKSKRSNLESSSSPIENGNSSGKKGVPAAEMRRLKDEMNLAQAAMKCATGISKDSIIHSKLLSSNISNMVQTILNIPKISNPSPTIIRDIFPFHNWFFSIQSLPFPLIETLSPVIVPSIRLTTKAKADKPRRNLQLASAALTTLIKSHPIYYLTNFKTWITTPASGLADFTKNGVLARQEALITLGAVVKAIWTPWAENEDGVLRARREKIGSDISAAFLFILHAVPIPGEADYMTTLFGNLSESMKRPDEVPWVLSVIATLPALLGKSFKNLDSKGVKPWMAVFNKIKCDATIPVMLRGLSNLCWIHLIFAFALCSRSAVFSSLFVSSHFVLINQIFIDEFNTSLKSQVSMKMLIAFIFAKTITSTTSPPTTTFEYYDELWKQLVQKRILVALDSIDDETINISYGILAAIVKAPSLTPPVSPTILLIDGFLDGTLCRIRSAAGHQKAIAATLEGACKEESLPGWDLNWTTTRTSEILELFGKCLDRMGKLVGAYKVDQAMIISPVLLSFWRNLLETFVAAGARVSTVTEMKVIFNFLSDLYTSMPLANLSESHRIKLVNLLVVTVREILPATILQLETLESFGERILGCNLSFESIELNDLVVTILNFESTASSKTLLTATQEFFKHAADVNPLHPMRSDLVKRWSQNLENNAISSNTAGTEIINLLSVHLTSMEGEARNFTAEFLHFTQLVTKVLLSTQSGYAALSDRVSTSKNSCQLLLLVLMNINSLEIAVEHQLKLPSLLDHQLIALVGHSRVEALRFSKLILENAGLAVFTPILRNVLVAITPDPSISNKEEYLLYIAPTLLVALKRTIEEYDVKSFEDRSICIESLLLFWNLHFRELGPPVELSRYYNILEALCGASSQNQDTQTETQDLISRNINLEIDGTPIHLSIEIDSLEKPTSAQAVKIIDHPASQIESVEESMDISKIENLESSGYRSDNSAAIPVGARTNRIRKLESSKSSPSILVSSKGTTANKRKLRGSSSSFAELPTSAIGFGEEDCAGGSSELIPSRREMKTRARSEVLDLTGESDDEADGGLVIVSQRSNRRRSHDKKRKATPSPEESSPLQPQLSSNSQVFLSKKAAGKRKEFSVSPTDQRFDSSQSQSLPPDSIPSTRKKAKLNNSISFDKTSSDTRKNLEITTIPETAPERSVAGPSFKNYQDSSATLTSTSSIESNRKATILAFLALKDDEILDLVGELGTESMQRLVNLGAQAGKTFRGGNRKKVLKSSEI